VEQLSQEVASRTESGLNSDTVQLVYNHISLILNLVFSFSISMSLY